MMDQYQVGTLMALLIEVYCMVARPRLPDPVEREAERIKDEHDYPSLGEAIRHVFQEAGHDV